MTILYIICAALAAASVILTVLLFASRRREAASEAKLTERGEKITALTAELARAASRAENLEAQGERDRQELEKLQASFRLEFRNLANEILEEKSEQFKRTNKESLDKLLDPFKTTITDFRERVDKMYSDQAQQHGVLKTEIKNLLELNHKITEQASNLTNALRGNSKVQGDWGEMILQTILENSGLREGSHYFIQKNLKDEQGANLRPDVVVRMPGEKEIVIDSKVSLTAFVGYTSAEDEAARKRLLGEHVQSVRKHLQELGSKGYQELLDSPDFVVMFIPNEPAFMAALQCDDTLWDDAYKRKVVLSSPTNLLAILRIVHDLWQREKQNRNYLDIAEQGAKLYDKFVGFVDSFEVVGKGLSSAQNSYDKALGQLKDGPGNLVRQSERLRELGVKVKRSIPDKMLQDALPADPAEIETLEGEDGGGE